MAIFALSIWYRSSSLSVDPNRLKRASQVLYREGAISGNALNIPIAKATIMAQPVIILVMYLVGYLPTNNSKPIVNNIMAAVDKFDGNTGPMMNAVGTPNHNKDQPNVYFSSAKRHKNHAI